MHKTVFFHASGRARGFTLIELMVTVAVLVILATVAVPNLQEFAIRSGMSSIRDDFAIALQRTRTDAVTRNTCVSMCQLATGSQDTCAPAAQRGNWQQGWVIYVNDACSSTAPAAALSADVIVAVRQPGNQRYALTEEASDGSSLGVVTYDARGILVSRAATFHAVDEQNTQSRHARDLVLSPQGRVSVELPSSPATGSGTVAAGGNE